MANDSERSFAAAFPAVESETGNRDPRDPAAGNELLEPGAAAGSWLEYKIGVKPHRIHIVETEYPDNADRGTSVSVSEPNDPEAAKPWGMLRSTSGYATGTVGQLIVLAGTKTNRRKSRENMGNHRTGSARIYCCLADTGSGSGRRWTAGRP